MDAALENNLKSKKMGYSAFAGALILVILGIGTISVGSVYMMPVAELMGVQYGLLALQFTFNGIGALVAALTFGTILGKIGPKALSCITAICVLCYFLTLSFAQNPTVIYVGAAIWAFGTSWGGFSIGQTEIAWWFKNNTGKLFSALSIGNGVISIILPIVIAGLIEKVGARQTALFQGIITAILMIIFSIALLKKAPAAYGLEQYDSTLGKETDPAAAAAAAAAAGAGLQKMTFGEILRTKPLWTVFFAVVISTVTMAGFVSDASPIFQSMGLEAVSAAACVSIYFALTMVFSFLFGIISDKKNVTTATIICSVIAIIGLIVAALGSGMGAAILAAILCAGFSVNVMIGSLLWTRIYGAANAGQLIGLSSASTGVGSIFGAAIAGRIFDATGSFDGFCYLGVVLIIIAIVLLLIGTNNKAITKVQERFAAKE